MTDDASTPKGWPPGVSFEITDDAVFWWREDNSGSTRILCSLTKADAIRGAQARAHAHYRTTREYRLEQKTDTQTKAIAAGRAKVADLERQLAEAKSLAITTISNLERQLAEVTRERDELLLATRRAADLMAPQVSRYASEAYAILTGVADDDPA